MTAPDFTAAIDHAIARLRAELSPNLTYHNWQHTAEDVLPAAQRLAELGNIPDDDHKLLEVAAAYHDIGYIYAHKEHEQIGARIAAQALPAFGFSPEQIQRITDLIMVTRLPQSPRNELEMLMADADLDVLGREDFFARSQELRIELQSRGHFATDIEWLQTQLAFLKDHAYFSTVATVLRQRGKERNISLLEERLKLSETV